MISIADVLAYDYGQETYECTFNDEEFNLLVLLLATQSAQEIFADYNNDPDFADALLADTVAALMLHEVSPVTEFIVGMMMPYAPASGTPTGWLRCEGQAVSRATYATLFTAIATTYGIGDGSTTFNLPDTRGRTLVGAGQASGIGEINWTTGAIDGRDRVTLDISNVPFHSHKSLASAAGGSTTHLTFAAGAGNDTPTGNFGTFGTGGNPAAGNATEPTPIVQPTQAIGAYIIKV